MKEVNVTNLRQNRRRYLTKVQRGERIRVTSRGKVVAEPGPPATPFDMAAAARARLRGSVLRYERPREPMVDASEWDMNR